MNCNCGVYKFTNKINGKIYIGSSKNLKKRNRDHLNLNIKSGCSLFRKAVIKYGVSNFSFDILECIDDLNKLLEKEQYYLDTLLNAKQYISGDSNYFIENGYNLSPIAKSRQGVKESNLKHKYKKVIEYNKNGDFIKIWNSFKEACEEYKIDSARITKSCKTEGKGKFIFRYYTENYPTKIFFKNKNYSKSMSEETKSKISLALKGRKTTSGKKIKQFDTKGNLINTFSSLSEAFELTGIGISSISNVLTNRSKTAGSYIWKEF